MRPLRVRDTGELNRADATYGTALGAWDACRTVAYNAQYWIGQERAEPLPDETTASLMRLVDYMCWRWGIKDG